jgi:hypothetical protein
LAFGGLVSGSFVICGAAVAVDESPDEEFWGRAAGWDSRQIEAHAFIMRLLDGADLQEYIPMTDRRKESFRSWVEKLPEKFGIPEGTGGGVGTNLGHKFRCSAYVDGYS